MKNRYYRIFQEDGKALMMAFDQGGTGKNDWAPETIIPAAVRGGLDGILTTYGVIKNFGQYMGKIGVLMRIDAFPSALSDMTFLPTMSEYQIEDAVRLGVDGIVCNGMPGYKKDGVDYDKQSAQMLTKVVSMCDKYGLLAGAEMLPNNFSKDPKDRSISAMKIGCRLGAELGMDFIKTEYVGPVEEFKAVVENCYVPIVALGGPYSEDSRAVLQYVRNAIDAGCKGVVIGRNICNHKNVEGIVRALHRVIHGNAAPDEAMEELNK